MPVSEKSLRNLKPFRNGNVAAAGRGAPKDNVNSLKHGLRSKRRVPAGGKEIGLYCDHLQADWMAAVELSKGTVNDADRHLVDEIVKWERHGLLTELWLMKDASKMTFDQRLAHSREVPQAARNKNKAIAALGIGDNPASIVDALYAPQAH